MAETTIATYTGHSDIYDIYFVQVDRNNVLFSDGYHGLYCYPGFGTTADAATGYLVQDLVPFLPDVNGGAGIAITGNPGCPYAPSGKYLTLHKNRVFMADPITSTVYYSGTRTDYDRNDKDSFTPPHDADTPIKPWELWNIKLDLSRANVGHGASMVIGNLNEKIVGLASSEEGLWVFKDNQILLWTWPDSAAPHEVTQGASVQEVASNVGLVSYRTLVKDKGNLFFLGMVENGEYKIFVMSGGEITVLTVLVDNVVDRIVNPEKSYATMHGGYFLIFADTGEGVKPFIAVNTETGSVVELDGAAITAATTWDAYGKIILGSGNTLLQYPAVLASVDTDGTPWRIRTQRMDAGRPFHDNKFRKIWSGIDTLDLSGNVTARNEVVDIVVDFDNDTLNFEKTVSGRDTAIVNLSKRSSSAELEIYGTALGKIRVNNIGVAVRDRKDK